MSESPPASRPPPPRKRRGWRRFVVDLCIALLIFGAISLWQGRDLQAAGSEAPDFQLTTLDGESVRLSELRGRKVLLYFWAPWCGVCKSVGANVASIAASSGDRIAVLPVALGYESEQSVAEAAKAHGLPGGSLLGTVEVSEAYSIRAFPTLYVVNEEGRIAHAMLGYTTKPGLWWRLR